MPDRSRIPQDIAGAVAFVDRTDNYQQAVVVPPPSNGIRLGLTAQNITDHHTKLLAIDLVFIKWSDLSQKTTPVNDSIVLLLADFRTFEQPLLDIIASSTVLNTTDEAVYNLVGDSHHKAPTHRTVAITEKCFPRMLAIGGGEMVDHVRTSSSSKRDHIFDEASGFECAYTITDTPTPLTDPENAKSKTFTKASAIVELGAPNKGKYINHCERWVFSPNTKFNGPWSASQSDLIE